MKPIKEWNREFIAFFKENSFIAVSVIIALPLLTCAWIQMYAINVARSNIQLCFADYFIITKHGTYFFVVIVLMSNILCASLNRNDFNINRVIRIKNLHKLWIKQSYFSLLISFFISIYLLIINSVIGFLNLTVLINFDQKQSQFGLANQGATTNQVSILTVIAITFLFGFLTIVLMNYIYQLIRWITNKDTVGLVALIIIGYFNQSGFGINYFAGVYYSKWLPYRPTNLLILVFGLFGIYIAGLLYSGHKEFLNAKSV